jgi:uncharacterized protein
MPFHPATSETISIRNDGDTPQLWTLRLRIPGWLKLPARITVNGAAAVQGQSGSFAALRRQWKRGDVVELRLPQDFRGEPIDDLHPDVVAMMRGPLMLVGIEPPEGLEKRPLPIHVGFGALGHRADAWTRNDGGQRMFLCLSIRYKTSNTRPTSRAPDAWTEGEGRQDEQRQ